MRADPDALMLSMPMRYFCAVADAGSVSLAAQRLHVAASAVSRQITALEDSLGVALFQRAQRGMRLTEAGERLAGHLRVVCSDAGQTLDAVRGLHDSAARCVRIACTEGFVAGLLPQALADFRADQPEARVEISVCAPDEVLPRLHRREADLGLLYAAGRVKDAEVRVDRSVPTVALMRADHPLATRRQLTVDEAAAWPLLMGAPGTTARALFDTACALRGLQPTVAVSSTALAPLLALVGPTDLLIVSQTTAAPLVGLAPPHGGGLAVPAATAAGDWVAVPFAAGELPARRLMLLAPRGRALPASAEACATALTQVLLRAQPASAGERTGEAGARRRAAG
ncbi:LysR family transcriptional regulator [Pseudaquabacterium rugosum]|jgi:DNA-binding transcriptional LysR family regulator|uniref:LysR family transcriptional regulator n=1 Tax=Pseudaquabacterium rugosum TaxID=2984194 RepID=A0ABU9BGG9_9BURK